MLWNWFGFGRNPGVPRDRILFPFRDGTRTRRIDPVRVENVLIDRLGYEWTAVVAGLSAPFPPGVVGDMLDSIRRERADNRIKVLAAIDDAFDVHEFRDRDPDTRRSSGLTDLERFGLLDGYSRYVLALLEYARPFSNAQSRASPSPENPAPPSGPESTSDAATSAAPVPAN